MIESSYLFSLILGGIVLAFSIFAGGEADKDFDGDIDADIDAEMSGDGGLDQNLLEDSRRQQSFKIKWLPLLSMRFWTFGLSTYGGLGMALTALDNGAVIVFVVSALTGFSVGWIAAQFFRALKLSSSNSVIEPKQLQGSTGKVLLPITPGKTGKVRLIIDGQVLDFLAMSKDHVSIGEEIMLVNMEEDRAIVAKIPALTATPHSKEL